MADNSLFESGNTELRFGSYRVIQPLGSGGMSSVYKAVHVETGHEVALKVLPEGMAENPIVLQRFLREARSAESLEHPHIVSIFDRGVDRGRHYLVLEYVPGSDLHEFIQRRGPLDVAEGIRVVRQVAEGLDFAAGRGLVHRDVKPSNILRGPSGEIKIIDLGLALQTEFEDERVTREGTTVGTVDYMAPEQARDSRAASLQSDIYSLGCTFYYLLTGIPPYPGGDITDKLTRHAKSPPPDVRDLRPDVPASLAAIMLRMMAKRLEDRYTTFGEVIADLDRVVVDADSRSPSVALVPLGESGSVAAAPAWHNAAFPPTRAAAEPMPPSSIPEISLANLPPEISEPGGASRFRGVADENPLPARAGTSQGRPLTTSAWVAICTLIGVGFVGSVLAIDRFVRSSPAGHPALQLVGDDDEGIEPVPEIDVPEPTIPPPPAVPSPPATPAPRVADLPAPVARTPAVKASSDWVEPEDREEPAPSAETYSPEILGRYLPAWALAPVPTRLDGRPMVVRRVVDAREPSTVSLRMAIDEGRGVTEIADEGPFLVNDFRIPGENRIFRARPGYRPVIRIERPTLDAVRSQAAAIELKGKNLTLDSLDLVLDVSKLSTNQGALFSCAGSNLTVINCTITLVNPASQPFTLVRAEGSSARGSQVRFENTLIRGPTSSVFDFGKGAVDVAVRGSVFLGSQGPIVRVVEDDRRAVHRFSVLGSVLACRGPVFKLMGGMGAGDRPASMMIRSFDAVYGRFRGPGIASVIAVDDPAARPARSLDWLGQRNMFCGWKGYLANGTDHAIRIPTLAAFRSTWNGSDGTSMEISSEWPQPARLDESTPEEFFPFAPGREAVLRRVARPRPFLGSKTLWTFATPSLPMTASLAPGPVDVRAAAASGDAREVARISRAGVSPPSRGKLYAEDRGRLGAAGRPGGRGRDELIFDADSARWHGDLGAFLRDVSSGGKTHLRVRAIGVGPRPCSPVRLPDGLTLEVWVDPPPHREVDWLSWYPAPDTTGGALLDLRGGALLLSNLRLQADDRSAIESLIRVEAGDLVLDRCRLVAPPGSESKTIRLVSFEAPGTRPLSRLENSELFLGDPDRPVCALSQCILITGAAALRAELGRGLVALSHCAVAAGTDAILLNPGRVARGRFEADLWLGRCTLFSERNIIRLGPWPGVAPGPDRPWLITSDHCAFLDTYDRRASETALLRVDEEAMAGGALFWQANGDAYVVNTFTAAGTDPPPDRPQDTVHKWVNFWGANHIRDVSGPRIGSNHPTVRPLDRPRPGRVEPSDLILDPTYHPFRSQLDVGADLFMMGISPRSSPGGRRR